MKKTKQKMKKERGIRSIALSQIIILVVATVAFAWMIGSEVKVVSASAESEANCYAQRFCVDGKIYPGHLINPDLPSETCVANNMIPALETCSSGQCNGNECFYDFNKPHNFIIYLGTGIALGDFLLRAYNTINKAGIGSKVGTLAGSFGPYPVPPKTPGFLGKTFGGTNLFGQILYSAAAAFGTRMLIMAIVKAFGTSEENMQGLQTSTLIGAGLGTLFGTLAAHYGWFAAAPVLGGALIAAGIVIVAALTYLLVGYKLYSREIFTFRTMLWQPPVGGSDCNKCNLLKVGTGDNQVV